MNRVDEMVLELLGEMHSMGAKERDMSIGSNVVFVCPVCGNIAGVGECTYCGNLNSFESLVAVDESEVGE